ncbi:MAG: hypothetical protein NZ805_08210 [Armatimonadetes bacterium]|nr:hypothetical protein [Armatimonadota bacterium]MDW8027413.1 hypothetical protein [Armatimonadota bacterium]
MGQGEPIEQILERYKGRYVFVVIEVLSTDPKTQKPLTGRVIAVTADEDEAGMAARKAKHFIIRWVGEVAEVIVV